MFGLGPAELIIVLVIVLVLFGGKKLPQIGDGMGRAIKNFKGAIAPEKGVETAPAARKLPDNGRMG
jgi:sec-independent protein translocase protein TatA